MKIYSDDLLMRGGPWLAEAREYMKSNCLNGDGLTWGSTENTHLTVIQVEDLACCVAARILNDLINRALTLPNGAKIEI